MRPLTDKQKQDCYICGSYKKRTADYTAHFIRTDLLTAGMTEHLRKVTSYAAKHEAQFMKLLTKQTEDGSKRRNAARGRRSHWASGFAQIVLCRLERTVCEVCMSQANTYYVYDWNIQTLQTVRYTLCRHLSKPEAR